MGRTRYLKQAVGQHLAVECAAIGWNVLSAARGGDVLETGFA